MTMMSSSRTGLSAPSRSTQVVSVPRISETTCQSVVAGRRVGATPSRNHARIESVGVGMTESDARPKTSFAPRPRNEIEKARSRPEAREFSLLTTVNDLKSKGVVEVDGARHVVGRG